MSAAHWSLDKTPEATEELYRVFLAHLPPDQQPAPLAGLSSAAGDTEPR
jgi:hypothetical protein